MAIEKLGQRGQPLDLDARPLVGREPLWRMRVGALRIIYRQLTPDERRLLGLREDGYRIVRIVYRRDLERVLKSL